MGFSSGIEKRNPDEAQKTNSQQDYNESPDSVDPAAVPNQKLSNGSGKGSQNHKHDGKSSNKAQCVIQGLPAASLWIVPGKIGEIQGKHR